MLFITSKNIPRYKMYKQAIKCELFLCTILDTCKMCNYLLFQMVKVYIEGDMIEIIPSTPGLMSNTVVIKVLVNEEEVPIITAAPVILYGKGHAGKK